MSLRTTRHEAKAAAKAGATSARRQARRATKQVTPLARSSRQTAERGVYRARVWAAPRVERAGQALEERVAPKVSGMLAATARRMEPAPPKHRRRWPKALAGIGMLAAAGAAAVAAWRSRRGSAYITKPAGSGLPEAAPNGQADGHQTADAETADINGQVRTP
jgi:hypothetical protein